MNLNDNARLQITVTAVTSINPDTATATLAIDDTAHPVTWDGAGVEDGGVWTRAGHTETWFAGPAVPADQLSGATVLTRGLHIVELRVKIGGTIAAVELPWIRVA